MTLYIDIKPELEWVKYKHPLQEEHAYRTISDDYHIITKKGDVIAWRFNSLIYEGAKIDEAKAAAQTDYERRTAERFKKVEIPKKRKPQDIHTPDDDIHIHGYNTAIDALATAIAKATEGKP